MIRTHYSEQHFEKIKEWTAQAKAKVNKQGMQEYLDNLLKDISTSIIIRSESGETRNIEQSEIDDLMFQNFQNPITSSQIIFLAETEINGDLRERERENISREEIENQPTNI